MQEGKARINSILLDQSKIPVKTNVNFNIYTNREINDMDIDRLV